MKISIFFIVAQFAYYLALAQNVGIGTNIPLAKLHVLNENEGNSIAMIASNQAVGGQRYGVRGEIAGPLGAAVIGFSLNESASFSPFDSDHYGILGITGNTGVSVGGFTLQGIGLRGSAFNMAGIALYTTGRVRFAGIGEAANKVLVSDASGFATWQNIPTHNHIGEIWTGSALNGLSVNNTNTNGSGLRGAGRFGVTGDSEDPTGVGVLGFNNSAGNNHPFAVNSGVAGVSGTGIGVYAAAVQGTSLLVDKANFGLSAGIVAIIQNSKTGLTTPVLQVKGVSNQPVLELNNGFLQVGGTTRTAFRHTTSAANNTGNQTVLNYTNQASTDLLIVTHNYSPTNTYLNKNFGVFWNPSTNRWAIYLEDLSLMQNNIVFNVLIIKNP